MKKFSRENYTLFFCSQVLSFSSFTLVFIEFFFPLGNVYSVEFSLTRLENSSFSIWSFHPSPFSQTSRVEGEDTSSFPFSSGGFLKGPADNIKILASLPLPCASSSLLRKCPSYTPPPSLDFAIYWPPTYFGELSRTIVCFP